MGNIAMTRVDYRLVHGQVGGMWLKFLSADRIAILNDEVASDDFMVEMFNVSAPNGVKISCFTVEDGVKKFKENQFGDGTWIVLFKFIHDAKRAVDMGMTFDKINIGQSPAGKDVEGNDRKSALRMLFLSKAECEILEDFEKNKHIEVYSQSGPTDSPVSMSPIVQKLKF